MGELVLDTTQWGLVGLAAVLVCIMACAFVVEYCLAMSRRLTLKFLEAHASVDSIDGSISSHWANLGVTATLFLGSTSAAAGNAAIQKQIDDYPVLVSMYVTLTIASAAVYSTAVFLCLVHRTATAGLKPVTMTKYVLSMPRCIGGPLLLSLAGWIMGGLGKVISFQLLQNSTVAIFSFVAEVMCWVIVLVAMGYSFTFHLQADDVSGIVKEWQILGGDLDESAEEGTDEDAPRNSRGWAMVTRSLCDEISQIGAQKQKTEEFNEASKALLEAKHEDCLAKLKQDSQRNGSKPCVDQSDEECIRAFKVLRLMRQVAQ